MRARPSAFDRALIDCRDGAGRLQQFASEVAALAGELMATLVGARLSARDVRLASVHDFATASNRGNGELTGA